MTMEMPEQALNEPDSKVEAAQAAQPEPLNPEYWNYGYMGSRLAVATIAAMAMGALSHESWPGSIIALIALLPLGLLVFEQTRKGWSLAALISAAIAGVAWLGIVIEPGPTNLLMFWIGCGAMEIARRTSPAVGASETLGQLALKILLSPATVISDGAVATKLGTSSQTNPVSWLPSLVLPVCAVVVFGMMFAIANPMIGDWLDSFSFGTMFDWFSLSTLFIMLGIFVSLWAALRPVIGAGAKPVTVADVATQRTGKVSRFLTPAAIMITLVLMNVMFAVENVLDLSYIWQGVTLPDGLTYKQYVHRGAYTLIVTALLAAGLILFMFRRGGIAEGSNTLRWLVYVWILQNILLVASSAKRTVAYAYFEGHMTEWRIAALCWMGLVALGLILIGVRIFTRRENGWLIDMNLLAAAAVLLVWGLVDTRAYAANWNAKWALEKAVEKNSYIAYELYLPYIKSIAPAAIPALRELVSAQDAKGVDDSSLGQHSVRLELRRQESLVKQSQSSWQSYVIRYGWY
jgi:hypothetical protein